MAREKIRIVNLCKRWRDVTAIDNMNLSIEEGDFITLLGPSGCGKTTTLRSIAGLEEPTSGELYLNNKLVFSKKEEIVVSPAKRNLGLVFQSYALWPHMTVFDNIAFGLRIKKLPKSEVKMKVLSVLKDMKLEGYEERYPQELSGGQQQRIAIARMIVNRPDIYLMDEPLSNLDAKLRVDMRSELKELHQRSGATTVYVTHDQVEAMTMSTKISIMKDGVIQQIGTPEEVYRRPANLFVAEFISNPKMNFFNAEVLSEGGNRFINAGGIKLNIKPGLIQNQSSVKAAIRPEDFIITDSGIEYEVTSYLPSGSTSLVYAKRGEDKIAIMLDGSYKAEAGDKIKVGIKKGLFNLYDIETGNKIF